MLLRRLPVTFTTPSPQKLAAARRDAGLTGFSHRYMSEDISAPVGGVATSWADYVGGASLAGANGPTVRALSDGSGRKYLEFDGVNDTVKNDTMGTSVQTVILIARGRATDTGTTIYASGTGVSINRSGTTGTVLNTGNPVNNALKLDGQWRFVAAVATASVASLTIDATKVTGTPNGAWGTSLRLAAQGTPANWSMLDIAEVVTFPTSLSDADIALARTAAKASYPTLLL